MKKERQLWILVPVMLLFTFGLNACNRGRSVEAAGEEAQPAVSPAEQDFIMKAAQANLAEIDLSRIAKQESKNDAVRDYANMVESDHTQALRDITVLMKDEHVPQARSLSPETQQNLDVLKALPGAEFDREYINLMVANHEKLTEMFWEQSATAQNSDVKKYVDGELPVLEMHLQKARKLQSTLYGVDAKP